MGLNKIISGGQTGADLGGLIAAKDCNIPTGGHCPKGWKTEDGPNLELGVVYGLVEDTSFSYVPRTKLNVKNADGTVIFSQDWGSIGTKLTVDTCVNLGKPYIKIDPSNLELNEKELAEWILKNNVKILNVAGNRESKSVGIGRFVMEFMKKTILEINK